MSFWIWWWASSDPTLLPRVRGSSEILSSGKWPTPRSREAKKAQRQRQKEAIDRAKAILREQIAEQRKKERFGGQTGSVAGEDAERFASLPEVKTAITHMIQTLASLPPPGPGPLSDNVGFSGGTNTSMRNFLSRIEEGEDLPPHRLAGCFSTADRPQPHPTPP